VNTDKTFKPGDLLTFYGTDRASLLIRAATASLLGGPPIVGPSHVGIVVDDDGVLRLLESTSMCATACLCRGVRISGVQLQSLNQRIAGHNGRIDLYRPRSGQDPTGLLSADQSQALTTFAARLLLNPLPYDWWGAIFSGTRVLRFLPWLPATERAMFCSELVARCLMHLGLMNHGPADRFNPASLLRTLLQQGTYTLHTRGVE
jgi:hypothetical protein